METASIKKKIPVEWPGGIIIKFQKKGDLTKCESWGRPIMLIIIVRNIFAEIILKRLKSEVNKAMRL